MKTQNPNISAQQPIAAASEFEVQSSEFKVQGSGHEVPGPWPRAQVSLSDGRHGVRAQLQVEAREPARDEIKQQNSKIQNSTPPAVLDFIASDDTLDRYGEVLDPGGWHLDNYRRNPVFQNAHQYGDIIFTLGKALLTEVRNVPGPDGRTRLALYQRVEFAVEANPVARIAYALYKGKFLNAVSVGFIPLRWEDGEGEAGRAGAESPRCRRRYLEQELLEVSAVGIPANPAALQLGLRAGAVAKSDLEHMLELLRASFDSKLKVQSSGSGVQGSEFQADSAILYPPSSTPDSPGALLSNYNTHPFRSDTAGVETNTSALGADADGAQWLRLARALRDLLRRG